MIVHLSVQAAITHYHFTFYIYIYTCGCHSPNYVLSYPQYYFYIQIEMEAKITYLGISEHTVNSVICNFILYISRAILTAEV